MLQFRVSDFKFITVQRYRFFFMYISYSVRIICFISNGDRDITTRPATDLSSIFSRSIGSVLTLELENIPVGLDKSAAHTRRTETIFYTPAVPHCTLSNIIKEANENDSPNRYRTSLLVGVPALSYRVVLFHTSLLFGPYISKVRACSCA